MEDKPEVNNKQYALVKLPDGRIINSKTKNLPSSSLKTLNTEIYQNINAVELK